MLAPIQPPTAAAPLVFLALVKIARTPTARLALGYRLLARSACPPIASPCCDAGRMCRTVDKNLRPLGEGLLLDRLLAGGIVGQVLPLALARGCPCVPLANALVVAHQQAVPLGAAIDLLG